MLASIGFMFKNTVAPEYGIACTARPSKAAEHMDCDQSQKRAQIACVAYFTGTFVARQESHHMFFRNLVEINWGGSMEKFAGLV